MALSSSESTFLSTVAQLSPLLLLALLFEHRIVDRYQEARERERSERRSDDLLRSGVDYGRPFVLAAVVGLVATMLLSVLGLYTGQSWIAVLVFYVVVPSSAMVGAFFIVMVWVGLYPERN